jgi:hypothetical protein
MPVWDYKARQQLDAEVSVWWCRLLGQGGEGVKCVCVWGDGGGGLFVDLNWEQEDAEDGEGSDDEDVAVDVLFNDDGSRNVPCR